MKKWIWFQDGLDSVDGFEEVTLFDSEADAVKDGESDTVAGYEFFVAPVEIGEAKTYRVKAVQVKGKKP